MGAKQLGSHDVNSLTLFHDEGLIEIDQAPTGITAKFQYRLTAAGLEFLDNRRVEAA